MGKNADAFQMERLTRHFQEGDQAGPWFGKDYFYSRVLDFDRNSRKAGTGADIEERGFEADKSVNDEAVNVMLHDHVFKTNNPCQLSFLVVISNAIVIHPERMELFSAQPDPTLPQHFAEELKRRRASPLRLC